MDVRFQPQAINRPTPILRPADLIVLDKNLFEIPEDEIANANVLLTLVDGNEVYRDPEITKGDE